MSDSHKKYSLKCLGGSVVIYSAAPCSGCCMSPHGGDRQGAALLSVHEHPPCTLVSKGCKKVGKQETACPRVHSPFGSSLFGFFFYCWNTVY